MSTNNGTHREAIDPQIRQAANMIHMKLKMAALSMHESQDYWMGKGDGYYDGYFEGFEDGLNAAKLHVEDAMQAFVDGELVEEVLGDA